MNFFQATALGHWPKIRLDCGKVACAVFDSSLVSQIIFRQWLGRRIKSPWAWYGERRLRVRAQLRGCFLRIRAEHARDLGRGEVL